MECRTVTTPSWAWAWVIVPTAWALAACHAPIRPDGEPPPAAMLNPDTARIETFETGNVDFDSPAALRLIGDGWRDTEEDDQIIRQEGTLWAASVAANLHPTILEPRPRTLRLEMQPMALKPKEGEAPIEQCVGVLWNGTRLGECRFDPRDGWSFKTFQFNIPAEMQMPGENTLLFQSRYAVSARHMYGEGNDGRSHAFGIKHLELSDGGTAGTAWQPRQGCKDVIEQPVRTRVTFPIDRPQDVPVCLAIDGIEATGKDLSCRVSARYDAIDGPQTQEILPWTPLDTPHPAVHFTVPTHFQPNVEFVFETRGTPADAAVRWRNPRVTQPRLPHDTRTPALPSCQNAVVIILDALRADAVGCYGAERPASPAIDAFAREGVIFEHAYSPIPYTYASTWSLLTGMFAFQHGAFGGETVPTAPSIAQTLHAAGILTGFVTASPLASSSTGHTTGFDETLEAFEPLNVKPDGDPGIATARAVDFIQRHAQQRFFLYIHYRQPHNPYRAPSPYFHLFTGDPGGRLDEENADWRKANSRHRENISREEALELRARYDENVRTADAEVERLLAAMRDAGLLGKTAIIITADHGEAFGEHDHVFGHSVTVYEEVTHIPLLLGAPGIRDSFPARCTTFTSTVDLLPSVCAMLGVTPPGNVVGKPYGASRSESPGGVMAFAQAACTNRGALNTEKDYWAEAYWFGRFKLIRENNDRHTAVYDLEQDPHEDTNLAPIRPVLTGYLLSRANAWKDQAAPRSLPTAAAPNPESDKELLKALGYL